MDTNGLLRYELPCPLFHRQPKRFLCGERDFDLLSRLLCTRACPSSQATGTSGLHLYTALATLWFPRRAGRFDTRALAGVSRFVVAASYEAGAGILPGCNCTSLGSTNCTCPADLVFVPHFPAAWLAGRLVMWTALHSDCCIISSEDTRDTLPAGCALSSPAPAMQLAGLWEHAPHLCSHECLRQCCGL